MIKVIIIDDEPLATELVKEYLSPNQEFEIVATCYDGFTGLKAIQRYRPDLIFLDIQMPKLNGFELLEIIEDLPQVIFTTAYDQYAMKAFEVNAIDYLLKPFSKERFDSALSKIRMNEDGRQVKDLVAQKKISTEEGKNRVVVKVKDEIKIIPIEQISHFEANDDYVNIYCKEGKFLKNARIGAYEEQLNQEEFVRVHRSYLVNLNFVTKIEAYKKDSHLVVLKTGEQIPVSRSGYPKLKESLGI